MQRIAPLRVHLLRCLGVVALVFLVTGAVAARSISGAGQNVIANPGVEKPLAAALTTCSVPQPSVGVWRPYTQTGGYAPFEVTETAHTGKHSLNVQGPPLGQCSAYGVFQDLPAVALPADQSFTFSFWTKPERGTQTQEVIYGWRQAAVDVSVFGVTEDLAHGTETVSAWGRTRKLRRPLITNRWHHVELSVDAQTNSATLTIDGEKVGSTPAGSSFPGAKATVYLGQSHSSASTGSNFFYDDIALTH